MVMHMHIYVMNIFGNFLIAHDIQTTRRQTNSWTAEFMD